MVSCLLELVSDRQRALASGPSGSSLGNVCTFLRLRLRTSLSSSRRGHLLSRTRLASPSRLGFSPFLMGADSSGLVGWGLGPLLGSCSVSSCAVGWGWPSGAGRASGSALESPGGLLGPELLEAGLPFQLLSLTSGRRQDVVTTERP